MKTILDWVVTYMTDNGLTDEEVTHFLNTKHKYFSDKTIIQYLREATTEDVIRDYLLKEYVKEYMLGL